MKQPTCVFERHGSTTRKEPPVRRPLSVITLAPGRMADTSRSRTEVLRSISLASSWVSIWAPWSWPISTTPRPSLSYLRYSRQAVRTSA